MEMEREDKGHVSKKCISRWWKLELKSSYVVASVLCCMMDVSELPRAAACCLQVPTITVILFSIIRELLRGGRGGCGLRRWWIGSTEWISLQRCGDTRRLGIINIARVIASADIRTIIMCPSSDARAASSYKTIFKTWNSRANFTVYIVFVICPKLDHFIIEFGLITIWYFWLSSVQVHCISC